MKYNILLAFSFARRDFNERYVGTGLGQLWYIISPIITIFIYTVIFSDFMKMKLQIIDSSYSYSIYLIPGLLAWMSFSAIIIRLSALFAEKSSFIKKINVPMYTYYLSVLITEFFLFILSISIAITFLFIIKHPVTIIFLWMIPVMLLQTILALSIGVIFSLFVPFVKDLKEAVQVLIQLWFWATPIIYMKEILENKYPIILILNPFAYYVSIYQDIFLFSTAPDVGDLLMLLTISLLALLVSSYLYKKMLGTIKDII